jgi:hypothetical protein
VKVSIIGQGYVGLTISVFAAEHHTVIGFDKNQSVVDALNKGVSHIEGVESSALARWISARKYRATADASEIAGSSVVVIAPSVGAADAAGAITGAGGAGGGGGGGVLFASSSFASFLSDFAISLDLSSPETVWYENEANTIVAMNKNPE